MVKNYVKEPRIQYDDKEIQQNLQLIHNNGASIQVKLGISIVEIYVKGTVMEII